MGPIEVAGVTKRFGHVTAVDDVTFSVRAGEVTGFLGRNGAGKTTTLRIVLGLERPTAGTVSVDGRPYADLVDPLRHVGSLLDARAVQPNSTATKHLLGLARSNGIDRRRVGEVLEAVGLGHVSRKPARTLSLGMLQRLGLAAALLGDPPILVLDEPLNGLDPEGIIWFRRLMRQLAAEGRTVLISSHLMAEMSVTADRLLVIADGRLLVDDDMRTFQRDHEHEEIRVRTPESLALRAGIVDAGGTVRDLDNDAFAVTGLDGAAIGALALHAGIGLTELAPTRRSLEEAFMELTAPGAPDATPPAPVVPAIVSPTLPRKPSAGPVTTRTRRGARFGDVVRSELVKFRSTRSGPFIVGGSIVAGVGTAVLLANATGQRYSALDEDAKRSFDPTFTSLRGRSLLQVSLSILGGLAMTSEYGADTIVPSLAAVPDRSRLFAAKALTTAGISLATGLTANIGGFLAGQAMLKRHGTPHDTLHSPGSARAVLGGGLHATAAALLGLGAGTLTRSSAGAVSTLFGAELLVPGLAPAFPAPISDILAKYWPTEAGARVLTTRPDPEHPELLGPWAGLAAMGVSTAAVLGAALAAFHSRDV
jgi:ABC-2 type transport system ATP-binding protein